MIGAEINSLVEYLGKVPEEPLFSDVRSQAGNCQLEWQGNLLFAPPGEKKHI